MFCAQVSGFAAVVFLILAALFPWEMATAGTFSTLQKKGTLKNITKLLQKYCEGVMNKV